MSFGAHSLVVLAELVYENMKGGWRRQKVAAGGCSCGKVKISRVVVLCKGWLDGGGLPGAEGFGAGGFSVQLHCPFPAWKGRRVFYSEKCCLRCKKPLGWFQYKSLLKYKSKKLCIPVSADLHGLQNKQCFLPACFDITS